MDACRGAGGRRATKPLRLGFPTRTVAQSNWNSRESERNRSSGRKPGRLVHVELRTSGNEIDKEQVSFVVTRSPDNLHLLTEAKLGSATHRGRVLPVRNRSAAQLLSREMEILCNDQIYQEAVALAAKMIATK